MQETLRAASATAMRATGAWVEEAESAVAIGRKRDPAARALDAQHRGVPARGDDGVGPDHVVVRREDRRAAGDVRVGQQAQERVLEVGRWRDVESVGTVALIEPRGPARLERHGRDVGEQLDRQVSDPHAALPDLEAAGVGDPPDHGRVQARPPEVGHDPLLGTGLDDREHALLALAQHDLVRGHRIGASGDRVDVDRIAAAAASRRLDGRARQAGGAEVLEADERGVRPQLQARLDEELLEEGVADLDDAPVRLARVGERRERRAMHAVAAGVGAEQDRPGCRRPSRPTAAGPRGG